MTFHETLEHVQGGFFYRKVLCHNYFMAQTDPFSHVSLLFGATPIGNLGDVTPRLLAAFESAQIIACEDTRHTRALISGLNLNVSAFFQAFHDHNENQVAEFLLDQARMGKRVLVVSDAGMPLICDPGYRLASLAASCGVSFSVLPGPSAPLTALLLSGFPTDSFTFLGFIPRKDNARRLFLSRAGLSSHTLVFFESPHRLLDTLKVMLELWGFDRGIAVCRELTKLHEEVLRGSLKHVFDVLSARGDIRGELVLIVEGGAALPASTSVSSEDSSHLADLSNPMFVHLLEKLDELSALGVRRKDGAKLLGSWFGFTAKDIYNASHQNRGF